MGIEDSVYATPTPLEGEDASIERSIEGPQAKTQPSMATPPAEDTRPKVLICGEWGKVPDGYLRHACGQLERDQLFINELAKQLVAELNAACQLNTSPSTKPKSGDKSGIDLQGCILQLVVAGACFVGYIFLHLFGVPMVERISMPLCWPHPNALVAYIMVTLTLAMALSRLFS